VREGGLKAFFRAKKKLKKSQKAMATQKKRNLGEEAENILKEAASFWREKNAVPGNGITVGVPSEGA